MPHSSANPLSRSWKLHCSARLDQMLLNQGQEFLSTKKASFFKVSFKDELNLTGQLLSTWNWTLGGTMLMKYGDDKIGGRERLT